MTVPYKAPVADITQRAKSAMKLNKRIEELTAVLNEDKQFFRDIAGGDKLDVFVPNVGKLTVTTPAPASFSIITTFDVTAFNSLPKSTRDMLYQLGVVADKTVSKPEGTASVRMTYNV